MDQKEQIEQQIMRPGDTFVAEECGCSFTVESGPRDENMVTQAPMCCCGHSMVKRSGGAASGSLTDVSGDTDPAAMGVTGAPHAMAD